MHQSREGYIRPVQNAPIAPSKDLAIAGVCPGLGQTIVAPGVPSDPLWGPVLEIGTAWASDPASRFEAASGGGLTAVAIHLLTSGRVQGIVQITADPDNPVANVTGISRTVHEVLAAAGSRYAPSAPLALLADLTPEMGPLAFIGKPCDAAALRAMQAQDAGLQDLFPIVMSFFCAGVPSLKGANRVVEALGVTSEDLAEFRYRGRGWPGCATATDRDGVSHSMTYHESWGGILSAHVQHRCKICADGTGKSADLVFADAWESDEDGYPLFEEQDGISLVLARTELGRDLLADCRSAGALQTGPFDATILAAIQPGQSGRRQRLWARLAALRLLGRPIPVYRGLGLRQAARTGSRKAQLRDFFGMIRRILRGRVRD